MVDRISALRIKGFRGASQPLELTLDVKKPIVLIFGENGTGKSTIMDALECVGTGNTSFVDGWKLGKGRRKESFIPTLGKKPADVRIEMVVGEKTYKAKLGAGGFTLINGAERPVMKVLRRKSLQAFIDADPAQRYREVSTFLDIPQIEVSESSLRIAAKQAEDRYNAAAQASEQARQHLYGLWEAEGKSGGDGQPDSAIRWARQQAQADPEQLTQKKATQAQRIASVEALLRASSASQQAGANLKAAQQQQQAAQEQLQRVEKDAANGSATLVTLLEDAKTYLEATPEEDTCPVCETTRIVPAQLVERLKQRLGLMQQLATANAARKKAEQRINNTQEQYEGAMRALLDAAQSVLDQLGTLPPDLTDFAQKRVDDSAAALTLATQLVRTQSAELPDLKASLDETGKQLSQLNAIRHSVRMLQEKTSEAKRSEGLSKRLQQAVRLFEQQRKAYVETVLSEIAGAVDKLYEQIHTDEDLGHLKLKLDENQRGSLLYGVAFAGKDDVQPQPYYSESHLDSLGLCIFLALAMRAGKECIVVLDDILGSVDAQHLDRTLDMLLNQEENLGQIILTSHYRPLRDRFRFAQGASGKVHLLELKPWSIEQGIRTGETKTYRDDLKDRLAADDFQREAIAGHAGILFECLLEFISLTYACKVPHRADARYTFGDLACAPNNKLKSALSISKPDGEGRKQTALEPIFDRLRSATAVRNLVGAHFNQWAGELPDDAVREMAELAIELADTLICDHCGRLPVSKKPGNHWDCGGTCKQTEMQPMLHPE